MRVAVGLAAVAFCAWAGASHAQGTPPAAVAGVADPFTAMTANVPGLVSTASGLKYKVVKSGPANGPRPAPGDAIKVHYEGRLASGAVFDSSYQRGRPAILMLDRLIPAWMEALPMMRPGDEWTLYVPSPLGYGASGAGPIPPDSPLVFRIELQGVLSAR